MLTQSRLIDKVVGKWSYQQKLFSFSHRIATPSPSSSSSNLNELKSHLPESVVQYLIQCVEQKVKHQTENKILKERIASLEMRKADICDNLAAKELRYQFTLSQLAEINKVLKETKSKLQPSSVATAFTQTTSYSDAVSTAHITSAKQPTTAPRSSVLQHFNDEEETEPPASASSWTTIPPSSAVSTH